MDQKDECRLPGTASTALAVGKGFARLCLRLLVAEICAAMNKSNKTAPP
jgi:hypothetical protein